MEYRWVQICFKNRILMGRLTNSPQHIQPKPNLSWVPPGVGPEKLQFYNVTGCRVVRKAKPKIGEMPPPLVQSLYCPFLPSSGAWECNEFSMKWACAFIIITFVHVAPCIWMHHSGSTDATPYPSQYTVSLWMSLF